MAATCTTGRRRASKPHRWRNRRTGRGAAGAAHQSRTVGAIAQRGGAAAPPREMSLARWVTAPAPSLLLFQVLAVVGAFHGLAAAPAVAAAVLPVVPTTCGAPTLDGFAAGAG
jgi:hypothetical protein